MEQLTIVVDGLSEEQVREDIKRMTKGFHLFFVEPTGMDYHFIQPFWGYEWTEYSASQLKETILKTIKINGVNKHFILVFKLDGKDRFAFCSWTSQLYDFKTKEYHELGNTRLSKMIADKILDIMTTEIVTDYCKSH
jgi:hypothetical protein